MGKVSNTATRLWLSQYDISGFLNAASLDVTQENIPVTTFSDTGPRRLVGNYDHKADVTGFFDGTDDQIDEIVDALMASSADKYLAQMFGSNAEGGIVYESIVALSGKPLSGASGGAVLLNASLVGRNAMYRGLILRNATVTGTGNGTGRSGGASTSGQTFAAIFRVFGGTFTSITMKLQESSDDAATDAYADITSVASGSITTPSVVYASTTAATEAYKRLVVSAFVGTNCVIGVTCGILKGT